LILSFFTTRSQQNLAAYVNPFIGTGGHGHTFPGAIVPFGMVQLSPDTRIDGSWDGCSGYHYSDSIIYGFSHTHLSGTGISDYGDIMLMPVVGKNAFTPTEYASVFSHKNEIAEAGYYSVKLDNGVFTELTATNRVGMHRYTFPKNENASLAFDFSHRDECTEAYLKIESPTRVIGYRRSKAWALDQYVAFVMEFSQPIINHIVSINGVESQAKEISHVSAKINFSFKGDGRTPLLVKVSLSMVDIEGADKNMKAELPQWDFDQVKNQAVSAWNKELSKIQVTDSDKNRLSIFYTALYHCFTQPNTASDIDGRYRGMDKKIHQAADYTHYTVFSLWDTFRAYHPLMTIVDRKRTNDFIRSLLSMYKQGGRLPVWELAANETDCMIGYHSASVIADAAVKGIGNFDLNLALDAMKKISTCSHLGLQNYIENLVITIYDEHESISKK
jgi:predicted alpha-1,2-mannosidase